MGNALRFLYGECCSNTTTTNNSHHHHQQHAHSAPPTGSGVSALSNDLYHFETTSQVPEGLSKHVVSSKKAQSNWYKKLSEAWRESKPPPKTPEEASRLIILTLKRHQKADVEGLLSFYGLPLPHSLVEHAVAPPVKHSPTVTPPVKHSPTVAPAAEHGLKFELHTLPVDAKAVADGDTVTVYVSTKEAREAACVPRDVQTAAVQRSKARAERNYTKADALHKQIIDAGYRVLPIENEEILAKKYRIRLRGIDAPESSMPYGKEAKEELLKLVEGKCLRVLIFAEDRYGRCVGDIYVNGVFVQEKMLKKGLVWHYTAYDKRPELEKWEKDARAKRVGLWAAKNPEMPWEYRKNRRQGQGK